MPLNKDRSDDIKSLIKKGGGSVVIRVFGLVFGYVLTLYTARILGQSAVGIYSLLLTVVYVGASLGRIGVDTAIVKYAAGFYSRRVPNICLRQVYYCSWVVVFFVSCIVSGIIVIFADEITGILFDTSDMVNPVKFSACSVPFFSLYFLNYEYLRGVKKVYVHSVLKFLLFTVSCMVIMVGLSALGLPAKSVVPNAIFYSVVLCFVISQVYISTVLPAFIDSSFWLKFATFISIVRYSFPLLLASSSVLVMGWVDTIFVGIFESTSDVGVYFVVVKLSSIAGLVLIAANTVCVPRYVELFGSEDGNSLRSYVQKTSKYIVIFSIIASTPLIVFPSFFLSIFGEQYVYGANALLVLVFGQLVNSCCGPVGYLMQMTGLQKNYQFITLYGLAVNIVLSAALVPIMGITGAAIGTVAGTLVWNIGSVLSVRRHHGFWILHEAK